MKIKNILLLVLTMSTLTAWAQLPEYEWGLPSKHPEVKDFKSEVYEVSEEGFYRMRQHYDSKVFQTRIYIDRFDEKNEKVSSVELTPKYAVADARSYQGMVYRDGGFKVFTRFFDKGKGKHSLFVQDVDFEGNYGPETTITSYAAEKRMNCGSFMMGFSQDESKTVVLKEHPFAKKANEKLSILMMDRNFEKLTEQSFTLDLPSKRVVDHIPLVTNEGQVFIYKQIIIKMKYVTKLLFWDGKSDDIKTLDMNMDGSRIIQIQTKLAENEDYIVAGYYSNNPNVNDVASGTFYFRYNKQGELVSSKLNDFEKAISDLTIKEIQEIANDQIVILGEVKKVEQKDSGRKDASGFPIKNNYYTNGDIYLHAMSTEGEPTWVVNLAKNNTSQNDLGYLNSYVSTYYNNKIYLMYNTSENDFLLEKKKYPGKLPVIVAVDNKGDFSGKNQYDMGVGSAYELRFCPNEFYEVGKGSYIVKGASGVEFKFGRMIFNE